MGVKTIDLAEYGPPEEEVIPKPLHNEIKLFYRRDDVSRMLPHARYSSKHGAARVMVCTVKDAHTQFLEENQGKVSQTLFQSLRPKNVRLMGSVALESCLCIYCTNVRLKVGTLNTLLAGSGQIPAEKDMLNFLTCPYEGRWPSVLCIDGKCTHCCDRMRPFHIFCRDIIGNSGLKWDRWERNEGGKVEPVRKEGTLRELLKELEKDICEPTKGCSFLQHLFVAYWQYSQFKACRTSPDDGEVVMVQDFGENRKAAYSSEVKSAHFGKQQITVHPVVCFYRSGDTVVRDSLLFLSDDTTHDHHAVREFTLRTVDYLRNKLTIKKLTIWSDGAASQYKGRGSFHDLSLLPYSPQRCFYGSEHGKGEADGETGILSQALRRATYQGHNFSCARDMVEYLSKHFGTDRRHYILVDQVDRAEPEDEVLSIPGTRKYHQFATMKAYVLRARRLACFCTACREDRPQQCLNIQVVGSYDIHKCKPSAQTVLNEAFVEPEASVPQIETPVSQSQCPKVGDYVKLRCQVNKAQKIYYAVVISVNSVEKFSVRFLQKSGTKYSFGEHDDEGLITPGPPDYYPWTLLSSEQWTMDHRGHYYFSVSSDSETESEKTPTTEFAVDGVLQEIYEPPGQGSQPNESQTAIQPPQPARTDKSSSDLETESEKTPTTELAVDGVLQEIYEPPGQGSQPNESQTAIQPPQPARTDKSPSNSETTSKTAPTNELAKNASSKENEPPGQGRMMNESPRVIQPTQQGMPDKRLSRKRTRQPEMWQINERKKRRQAGMDYTDRKGRTVKQREMTTKKDCRGLCRFKCSQYINEEERKTIFDSFWSLNDEGKSFFYSKNTRQVEKQRKRTTSEVSRKKNSIFYFFHLKETPIRVCKAFFLSTLDISQRRVEYFHKEIFQKETGIPRPLKRGKMATNVVADNKKDIVRQHIKSIPVVESHYCRASTSKLYFEAHLNTSKIYDLYVAHCSDMGYDPVKKHLYTTIFNTEFNIAFQKPKKDRCDKCELMKAKEERKEASEEERVEFQAHVKGKEAARLERNIDRQSDRVVISFDLQNVIPLPKAEISNFFYRRKLSTYNLTGHLSVDKSSYSIIWNEGISGRSGNDIASALYTMLEKILEDHPTISDIILWSDSCVPQNRNSIMTLALKCFLRKNPSINSITQKFSEPGHSCLQEVDSVHSVIERHLRHLEIFSPVGLLRNLTKIRKNKVIQMKKCNFLNFQRESKKFSFNVVPYTKVQQLKYTTEAPFHVSFKLSHAEEFLTELIRPILTRQKACNTPSNNQPFPTIILPATPSSENKCLLPQAKANDIKAMLDHMPSVDRDYMRSVCGL